MCLCLCACSYLSMVAHIMVSLGLIHMQPPIEKVLGEDFHLTPSGAMKKVKDCFYYVPLLSSLQAMLNQKDIRDQVVDI